MRKLSISKGTWKYGDRLGCIDCPNEIMIGVMGWDDTDASETEDIVEIVLDAGNTFLECNILPSDLLLQREKLLRACKATARELTVLKGDTVFANALGNEILESLIATIKEVEK